MYKVWNEGTPEGIGNARASALMERYDNYEEFLKKHAEEKKQSEKVDSFLKSFRDRSDPCAKIPRRRGDDQRAL